MSDCTKLPDTTAIDTEIRKHFSRVCALDRNCEVALTTMATSSGKKRKSNEAVKHEPAVSPSTLDTDSIHERKMLGMYLGKRLHAKYSNVVNSMLMGSEGFAILDLVPGPPSSFWKKERKIKLLSFFRKEIEPYLGSIEAIQPTF
jgi:hypothetical protein